VIALAAGRGRVVVKSMSDVVVRGVPMGYIFGPVPSRRLGLSLGVDLIPSKTCSYDCLYCQVGRTTQKVATPETFAPIDEVIRQLKEVLTGVKPNRRSIQG